MIELDYRHAHLLKGLVEEYIATGKPVGSEKLLEVLDVSVSSATVRSVLRDLEEEGYVTQPHTSAGRIPTDKGCIKKNMLTRPVLLQSCWHSLLIALLWVGGWIQMICMRRACRNCSGRIKKILAKQPERFRIFLTTWSSMHRSLQIRPQEVCKCT